MNTELSLLYPEWQSYGESNSVMTGALKMAESLFGISDFTVVHVPEHETLAKQSGVLGLSSIAPRFKETLNNLQNKQPSKIFTVGGTCGVEVAPVGYLNNRYNGDLAVLWFDAHGDLNTPESSPSGHFHGMALRTLLGEGPSEYTSELSMFLRPEQVFLIGTRDLDPPEIEYSSRVGISITTSEELSSSELLISRIKNKGFKKIYLHLDLDVLNPESFPDSLMQTPGGPSVKQIQQVMAALAKNFDVIGFSIVEYCEHQGGTLDTLKCLVINSGITIGSTRELTKVNSVLP